MGLLPKKGAYDRYLVVHSRGVAIVVLLVVQESNSEFLSICDTRFSRLMSSVLAFAIHEEARKAAAVSLAFQLRSKYIK